MSTHSSDFDRHMAEASAILDRMWMAIHNNICAVRETRRRVTESRLLLKEIEKQLDEGS